jgi:hypothetical protein
MDRQSMQQSGMVLKLFAALLLVLLLIPSWAAAGEIVESPPNSSSEISAPCSGMSSVSNTVHFEGNRWLQVCTNGTQLDGYVLDYGLGSTTKILSMEAEDGVYIQSPRVAVMAAGGIVVLWNQTSDQFQISVDTPIYMANFDYTGQQITPARNLQN